ncbi:MAG: 2-C-methyl-D-erythritol 4-phosphate cytidylyltransferase [Lachnospiraceae bacterium]|nr:2-C-methyl-D-erythritol 4-phosphate cytidylyltransferase [Lachnospiraceae bacterium]
MAAAGIVLAGGKGSRMQSDVPKQYMELLGKPLLYYALKAFEESNVESVVLVTAEGEEDYCRKELVERYGFTKVVAITAGGAERYASVWNGLKCLKDRDAKAQGESGETDIVLIHDGARPLVTAELINRLIAETEQYGACVAGMPVKDTIQMTDERGTITLTPKRDSLWTAQTPQAFEFSLAYDAYEQLMAESEINVTDDAMVVGMYKEIPIQMVRGSYTNIKVTTPEDLVLAEAFLLHRNANK